MIDASKFGPFFRFVLVGVISTLVHYALYLLLQLLFNATISYSIGYGISFFLNFTLSGRYTFKKELSLMKGVKFACAHICVYFLHIVLLWTFLHLGINNALVPIPVYCIVTPISFFLVRYVFKQ